MHIKANFLRRLAVAVASFLLLSLAASAQKWSVGTNLVDYANVGTLNLDAGVGIGQHWSLAASARYNPWTFREDTPDQFQNRKQSYAFGVRWWPWHVFSGWWVNGGLQYQEYNRGGWIFGDTTFEGDAAGAAFSAGYTLMLHRALNIEFGAGFWGGYTWYKEYSCPTCGKILADGGKWFVLPNEVRVAFVFIF